MSILCKKIPTSQPSPLTCPESWAWKYIHLLHHFLSWALHFCSGFFSFLSRKDSSILALLLWLVCSAAWLVLVLAFILSMKSSKSPQETEDPLPLNRYLSYLNRSFRTSYRWLNWCWHNGYGCGEWHSPSINTLSSLSSNESWWSSNVYLSCCCQIFSCRTQLHYSLDSLPDSPYCFSLSPSYPGICSCYPCMSWPSLLQI